jgi:hypothetical protein
MKKIIGIFLFLAFSAVALAQNGSADSLQSSKVTINKDPRLEQLAQLETDFNLMAARFTKGYRLLVLKSDNRDYAMKVRSYLLQTFPEEKLIMTYQSPFIKMKFGDFADMKDAEKYRNLIMKGGVVKGEIYIVPETIELKPEQTVKGN